MADFAKSYALVKAFEGGWCDVPGDAGGETYAGIARNFFPYWPGWGFIDAARLDHSFTQGSLSFSRYLARINNLQALVTAFYHTEWWDKMGIARFSQPVADELFEQAVNLGRGGSGRYLQRLCNAFNYDKRTGKNLFPDLTEDGVAGPKTLAALTLLLAKRTDDTTVVRALNGLQVAHYIGLGAKNPQHRKFVDGWLTRTREPQGV